MKFTPKDAKVQEILGGSNIYQIPNFQRDYSWGEDNYNDFLNDLLYASYATYNIEQEALEIRDVESLEDYFFGTFIVIGDYSNSLEKKVVDGQQRLTTMTLFLAAIREIIEEYKKSEKIEYEHVLDNALIHRSTRGGVVFKKARVINERLNPILPVNILDVYEHGKNGATHEPSNESQEQILLSYTWFKNQLSKSNLIRRLSNFKNNRQILSKSKLIKNSDYISFLDTLSIQLLQSTVIIIYSEDEESVNTIYRNFNFRGIPLNDVDLIKNDIFKLLDDDSSSCKIRWEKIESFVNVNEHSSFTSFFTYYFSSKYKLIRKEDLYKEFSKRIDNNLEDYESFLEELVKEAKHYKSIVKPEDSDKLFGEADYFKYNDHPIIKRRLETLNDLDISQIHILLLGLFRARENNGISSKQFKDILLKVMYFQSLYIMGKQAPNKLRGVYSTYARKFRETTKKDSNKLAQEFYKELAGRIPSFNDIMKNEKLEYHSNSNKMSITEKKNRALIKIILNSISIEQQVGTGSQKKNDSFNFIEKASIEHIIDKSSGIEKVNSLGNLILLEEKDHFNNMSKSDMYKKSSIEFTKSFSNQVEGFSDNEDIIERRNELLKMYYNIILSEFCIPIV